MTDILKLHEQTVNPKDYKPFDSGPSVFFGLVIKNKFDEYRFRFKPDYDTERLSVSNPPLYLYGICIGATEMYLSLLRDLKDLSSTIKTDITEKELETYKKLLGKRKLSCDKCFSYMRKGVFPVDGEHVLEMCGETGINIKNLTKHYLVSKRDLSYYQKLTSFVIFILL